MLLGPWARHALMLQAHLLQSLQKCCVMEVMKETVPRWPWGVLGRAGCRYET